MRISGCPPQDPAKNYLDVDSTVECGVFLGEGLSKRESSRDSEREESLMAQYHDLASLDLRRMANAQSMREIEQISDIGVVIFPSDADDETMAAISAIPVSDVGQVLYLKQNEQVQICNGFQVFEADTYSTCAEDETRVVIINGVALFLDGPNVGTVTVNANGICIMREGGKNLDRIRYAMVNGFNCKKSFSDYVIFQNKMTLDADMLESLEPKTLVLCGNKLTIARDVTLQALKEKEVVLIVGNKLYCPKELMGYLKVKALIGNRILSLEDLENETAGEYGDDEQ